MTKFKYWFSFPGYKRFIDSLFQALLLDWLVALDQLWESTSSTRRTLPNVQWQTDFRLIHFPFHTEAQQSERFFSLWFLTSKCSMIAVRLPWTFSLSDIENRSTRQVFCHFPLFRWETFKILGRSKFLVSLSLRKSIWENRKSIFSTKSFR